MSRKVISMRYIREILRLRYDCKLSKQAIAKNIGVGRTTVADCLKRSEHAGIIWPIPEGIYDDILKNRLYPSKQSDETKRRQEGFELEKIHQELKRKGTTLYLLWDEYKQCNPAGYEYSHFCDLYRAWAKGKKIWMAQVHKAGEKMLIITDSVGRANYLKILTLFEI